MTLVLAPPPSRPAAFGPRHEQRWSEFTAAVTERLLPLAATLPLPASTAPDASDRYCQWAWRIAEHLAPRLREPNLWRAPFDRLDESSRQAAVDQLDDVREQWAAEAGPLLAAAVLAYGTRYSALTWIDRDEVQALACHGFSASSWSRSALVSPVVLRAHGGILVGDAAEDPRFRSCWPVRDGHVGFYAGYRIESPDRQPVAALAVFDPQPRIVADRDIAVLRDLALIAQRRLWDLAQPSPSGRRRAATPPAEQSAERAAPATSPQRVDENGRRAATGSRS